MSWCGGTWPWTGKSTSSSAGRGGAGKWPEYTRRRCGGGAYAKKCRRLYVACRHTHTREGVWAVWLAGARAVCIAMPVLNLSAARRVGCE
jgi:hypothetical protein